MNGYLPPDRPRAAAPLCYNPPDPADPRTAQDDGALFGSGSWLGRASCDAASPRDVRVQRKSARRKKRALGRFVWVMPSDDSYTFQGGVAVCDLSDHGDLWRYASAIRVTATELDKGGSDVSKSEQSGCRKRSCGMSEQRSRQTASLTPSNARFMPRKILGGLRAKPPANPLTSPNTQKKERVPARRSRTLSQWLSELHKFF